MEPKRPFSPSLPHSKSVETPQSSPRLKIESPSASAMPPPPLPRPRSHIKWSMSDEEIVVVWDFEESRVKSEVDSDEEEAFSQAEKLVDEAIKVHAEARLEDLDVLRMHTKHEVAKSVVVREQNGRDKHRKTVLKQAGGREKMLRREDGKGKTGVASTAKIKEEEDVKVKEEPLEVSLPREDPRFSKNARKLRDDARELKAFGSARTPEMVAEEQLAKDIAYIQTITTDEVWKRARQRHNLAEPEIKEWYLSPLLYRIVNEGFDLTLTPIDLEQWKTIVGDLKNLCAPLQKHELEALFRQLDNIPTQGWDCEGRRLLLEAKENTLYLSELQYYGKRVVESPATDDEWDAFDEFRDTCHIWSRVLYHDIKNIREFQMKYGNHMAAPSVPTTSAKVADADQDLALQRHKEVNPSPPPSSGRKRRRTASPTSVPTPTATMSTPAKTTIDLTSPAGSPIAKRTKTSHKSDEKMIPATTSEPSNIPVPVTKVQDGPHLLIKKLSDKAKLPTRGSAFAAGYDLYAAKETVIPARGKGLVDTDLSMAVPAGTYGRIAPRSGLAAKNFIDTGAGVIDADYRGQVKVLLFNHSDVDFVVKEHDRVAQLILERIYTPEVMEVMELEESVRGEGGFGSTGVAIN